MRTFIALNFSDDFKKKISPCAKFDSKGIKWVETKNIHITLVFLGDIISDNHLPILKKALEPLSRFKSFKISVMDIGAFPDFKFPRVLWLGIDKGRQEVMDIYKVLKENLIKNGFIFEDKFMPHITIGRVKAKVDEKILNKIKNLKLEEDLSDVISSVDIMSSQLTPTGPIYNLIYSEKFKG